MITYKDGADGLRVYLDRRRIGTIKPYGNGFRYYPHNAWSAPRGEVFPTIDAVKRSLETS